MQVPDHNRTPAQKTEIEIISRREAALEITLALIAVGHLDPAKTAVQYTQVIFGSSNR